MCQFSRRNVSRENVRAKVGGKVTSRMFSADRKKTVRMTLLGQKTEPWPGLGFGVSLSHCV